MCLFFIKRAIVLSYIFGPLQKTDHPEFEGFLDIQLGRTRHPNTNKGRRGRRGESAATIYWSKKHFFLRKMFACE